MAKEQSQHCICTAPWQGWRAGSMSAAITHFVAGRGRRVRRARRFNHFRPWHRLAAHTQAGHSWHNQAWQCHLGSTAGQQGGFDSARRVSTIQCVHFMRALPARAACGRRSRVGRSSHRASHANTMWKSARARADDAMRCDASGHAAAARRAARHRNDVERGQRRRGRRRAGGARGGRFCIMSNNKQNTQQPADWVDVAMRDARGRPVSYTLLKTYLCVPMLISE